MGLVILVEPPAGEILPEPLVVADLVLDHSLVRRAARDPGPPAPLLPPVPIDKAHELARELTARGLAVRVLPADSWARLLVRAPTEPEALAEARGLGLAFLVRGGQWERERHSLEAVLRELIDNAARHGNRGNPDTSVALDLLVDEDRLVIAVTDDGPGFDASAALATPPERPGEAVMRAEARWRAGDRGGLGLLMIAGWADRLAFENGGRTAVVEKRSAPA